MSRRFIARVGTNRHNGLKILIRAKTHFTPVAGFLRFLSQVSKMVIHEYLESSSIAISVNVGVKIHTETINRYSIPNHFDRGDDE